MVVAHLPSVIVDVEKLLMLAEEKPQVFSVKDEVLAQVTVSVEA